MTPPDTVRRARYRLDPGVRRLDGGRSLLGGSPLRLLRLSAGGVALIDRVEAGKPVAVGAKAAAVVDRLVDDGILHPQADSSPFRPSDVTVVIPVRDRPEGLAATLDAVGPAGDVVVVDDGSTDAAAHGNVANRPGVRLLRRRHSGGPAAARNAGLATVETELVAFVDAGCTPEDDWLDVLLLAMADPRTALAAPRIGGRPSLDDAPLAVYESVRSALDLGPLEGPIRPRSRVPYVPTTCLLVRTAAAREVGGFDESMPVGEDVDFVWRLLDAGHRARYLPQARAGHDHPQRIGRWLRRRADYGTSAAPLSRRHPGNLRPLGISPWSVACWALLAGGRPRLALLLFLGTGAGLARSLDVLEHRTREAFRLVGLGHYHAGLALAAALTREWWPLSLAAVAVSRRARRAALAAVVVPSVLDWVRLRPRLDPLRWTALHVLDDAGYGFGVWLGCLRDGTLAPLVPEVRS